MENKNVCVCKDCAYFSQHYIKYREQFIPIECGTCMCEKLSGEERREFNIRCGCNFYKEKSV